MTKTNININILSPKPLHWWWLISLQKLEKQQVSCYAVMTIVRAQVCLLGTNSDLDHKFGKETSGTSDRSSHDLARKQGMQETRQNPLQTGKC